MKRSPGSPKSSLALVLSCLLVLISMPAEAHHGWFYNARYLVTDEGLPPTQKDPNLVNAWGIAFNPFGPVWVNNAETGTSTLYDGDGNIVPLVVKVPAPDGSTGAPTGIVYNGSQGFVVASGSLSAPSRFIFATEQGSLAAWAPTVDKYNAYTVANRSATGAIYKGLAMSGGGNGGLLYATDFHNNKIDVYDSEFKLVTAAGGFTDSHIPAGFAPFGIQAINGDLYVTYAMQDADREDDVQGSGLGYVDVYDPNGYLIRRLISRGHLNAPWGMAMAPAGFGWMSNRLLVANFGDGTINAYDPATGWFMGSLHSSWGKPIKIDGLWGISFGNGYANQSVNTLYFTAGPEDEEHGAYGRIDVMQ